MQVDCSIYTEGDSIVVDLALCTMYFDRAKVEEKAYQHFRDDFESAIDKSWSDVDDSFTHTIDFSVLDFDQRYDILFDLMYYHNVQPDEISITTHNQQKIYNK